MRAIATATLSATLQAGAGGVPMAAAWDYFLALVSHGLQLQSLWTTPAAAVSLHAFAGPGPPRRLRLG